MVTTTTKKETKEENINEQIVAAFSDFETVIKNKVNAFQKNKYADLSAVLNAVKPALSKHGLVLTQPSRVETKVLENGQVCFIATVETVLMNRAGEKVTLSSLSCPFQGNNLAQELGKTVTYMRRFSLLTACGITAEDDDDDGASLTRTLPKVDESLKRKAEEFANQGIGAYQLFFEQIDNKDRKALVDSGLHAQLKARSIQVHSDPVLTAQKAAEL